MTHRRTGMIGGIGGRSTLHPYAFLKGVIAVVGDDVGVVRNDEQRFFGCVVGVPFCIA